MAVTWIEDCALTIFQTEAKPSSLIIDSASPVERGGILYRHFQIERWEQYIENESGSAAVFKRFKS